MSIEAPRPTALITGAASGIGAAFAELLAAEGYRLILVDREPLPSPSGGESIRADLTDPGDLALIEDRCRSGLDLLINNAGFGHPTRFLETPIEAEIAMARLHMEAVLRLTHAALPAMLDRRSGEVVNTASLLGFFPSSTYSASKSWVINFTQATAKMARPQGVTVMALCPGFTRTGFHDTARMDMTKVPAALWMTPDTVAATALRDLRKRKPLSIPGWHNKLIAAVTRTLPPSLTIRLLATTDVRAPSR
ncbi:SDR family NAD(P)-dependent oxidoreductase [Glycomyces sp. NPDC047010]|uniref:SDR family NAD(P)-dependent oxidoreductase n=1 Tax=Glycomyces sp. NPDC047010 TaxID=3155023 RepID=UPI0033D69D38